MQISLKWLNNYIDISDYFDRADELAELLTNTGLEVEEIQDLSKQFKHIVIGQILEKAQHPNADKLSLCQVSTGKEVVHQIVCGAKNHKQGDRVVVALPGACLPGDFKIKPTTMRGVESNGMLCSDKELGISEDSEGIKILDSNAPIGEEFSVYQGLNDIVFELKVTPNRADCLSHFGLARELSCLLDRELKSPINEMEISSKSTKDVISLEVKDVENCPRFTARYISGVKVTPSPSWLKSAIESIGLNSINNVVDITNYVMMEMGQPLHAYDVRELKGNKVIVDKAEEGEIFVSLDGTELKCDGSELMIRDGERPVGLAGIVGGQNSGVQDDTTDLFIECAYFVPSSIRKTSRKFGVETDACYRFSRGVDPEATAFVLDRCCYLIKSIAGGEVYSDPYDFYPSPIVKSPFEVKVDYITERLGLEVDASEFEQTLTQIKCSFTKKENIYSVVAPAYRWDIERKEDLVEEFARLKSYDSIPEHVPMLTSNPSPHSSEYLIYRDLREKWTGLGYLEATNYAFLNHTEQNHILGDLDKLMNYGITAKQEAVKVLNPLNEDFAVMRKSLIPSVLKNVQHNSRRGGGFGRIFELGYAFGRDSKFGQDGRLALAAWGSESSVWGEGGKSPLVLEVKEKIEQYLNLIRAKSWKWTNSNIAPDFLHPGQSAALFFEGKVIGFVGTLHPSLRSELKIREEVVLAEFQLDALLRGQPKSYKAQSISKFPAVERDIAFICDESISAFDVMEQIKKAAGKKLINVELFDLFSGGNLENGMKSMAFRMHYQDLKATLEEDELSQIQKNIIEQVTKKLSIQVR